MNEWASRILSAYTDKHKVDLDEFMLQVTHDRTEHMYFDKEFNESIECKPTFEQLSYDVILSETLKNVDIIKALENIIHARMIGYDR